jgi:replicative DNA helicase
MNRLEKTILKNLIYNEEYARKVVPFIRQDYFSDLTERNVFKEISDFTNK